MDDIDAIKETEVSILRLVFTNESNTTRKALAQYFNTLLRAGINMTTRVIKAIDEIRDNGFTKGHWYRGVE